MEKILTGIQTNGEKVILGTFSDDETIGKIAFGLEKSGVYAGYAVTEKTMFTTVKLCEPAKKPDAPRKKPDAPKKSKGKKIKSFKALQIDEGAKNLSAHEKADIMGYKLTATVAGDEHYIREGKMYGKLLFRGSIEDVTEYLDMAMEDVKKNALNI